MMLLVRMAWMNLWRNGRRTLLLLCAMVVGLAGVLFFIGLSKGWLDQMVHNAIRSSCGHLKIMDPRYQDQPLVEHNLAAPPELATFLKASSAVEGWSERVTLPMLLSTPTHSRLVTVMGIDPETEARVSSVREALREGTYLTDDQSNHLLMGRRLADQLNLRLGKKAVLMAQQLGGDLGSGAFRVSGIYETGVGSFDESHVYILKRDAQQLLGLDNRVTEVVVMLKAIEDVDQVAAALSAQLDGSPVAVKTWKQLLPIVVQSVELSNRFVIPYYAVFYMAMAFGIINTLSMALAERTHEIGMMMALGMRRGSIVFLILLEGLMTACVAATIGLALGILVVGFFGHVGIDLSAFADAMDYHGMSKIVYPYLSRSGAAVATGVMVLTALIISVIPALRAARMVPVRALRTAR